MAEGTAHPAHPAPLLRLVAYHHPANPRALKAVAAALLCGVPMAMQALTQAQEDHPSYRLRCSPCGRNPVVISPEGCIFESGAVLRYIARIGRDCFGAAPFGTTPFQHAQVDDWLDFATHALDAHAMHFLLVHFGIVENTNDTAQPKLLALEQALVALDEHLAGRDFLVGGAMTIADIAVTVGLDLTFRYAAACCSNPRMATRDATLRTVVAAGDWAWVRMHDLPGPAAVPPPLDAAPPLEGLGLLFDGPPTGDCTPRSTATEPRMLFPPLPGAPDPDPVPSSPCGADALQSEPQPAGCCAASAGPEAGAQEVADDCGCGGGSSRAKCTGVSVAMFRADRFPHARRYYRDLWGAPVLQRALTILGYHLEPAGVAAEGAGIQLVRPTPEGEAAADPVHCDGGCGGRA